VGLGPERGMRGSLIAVSAVWKVPDDLAQTQVQLHAG
jgi:hypothetical protein